LIDAGGAYAGCRVIIQDSAWVAAEQQCDYKNDNAANSSADGFHGNSSSPILDIAASPRVSPFHRIASLNSV
jgi:hypothetical protein